MYIESVKYEKILDKYEIIELKVRGKKELREKLFHDIQDNFDLAQDEWDESLGMLTMTFDKKPKEQTLNMIKSYTNEWIEEQYDNLAIMRIEEKLKNKLGSEYSLWHSKDVYRLVKNNSVHEDEIIESFVKRFKKRNK